MIPNPFASPINFAIHTRSNVQNNFYLWDPKLGGLKGVGGYVLLSYNGNGYTVTSAAVSPESQFIQSGQGFFVRSTGARGSIIIKEGDKSATPATDVFRPANSVYGLRTTLQATDKERSPSIIDETMVAYSSSYSNNLAFDPVKPSNINENIGIGRSGQMLMVERRQPFVGADTRLLKLWNTEAKDYILQFTPENISASFIKSAVLADDYLKSTTPISLTEITTLNLKIDPTTASRTPDRFKIVFSTTRGVTSENMPFTKGTFRVYPNPISGKVLNIHFTN